MIKAVHARITGRVQGVFYRAWTETEANKRGLKGWVRNRTDGSVEALFAGDPEQVDDMLNACRSGPPSARVEDIAATEAEADEAPDQFEQRPTA